MFRVAIPFGSKMPPHKRDPYLAALAAVGIEPVESAVSLAGLDGLLLVGGTDVDPALYGAGRAAGTDEPDVERDRCEGALLSEALERDVPVLAICRGLQFLNAARGGTLMQHVGGHKLPERRDAHPVRIAPGSKLASILGEREYQVNSRHHQCVERVAPGLEVTATAPDGVIEGLEMTGKRFVVAVQWHPEDRTDGPDAQLFEAFRAAMVRPTFRARA